MPVYQTTFAVNAPAARVGTRSRPWSGTPSGTRRSREPVGVSSQASGSTFSSRSQGDGRWTSP